MKSRFYFIVALVLFAFPWHLSSESCTYSEQDEMCIASNGCASGNYFATADFLYWTTNYQFPAPFQVAQEAHITQLVIPNPLDPDQILTLENEQINTSIHTQRPDRKWSPGFRIGVGYQSECGNWDVQALWTYYHNHAHKHLTTSDDTDLVLDGQASLGLNYNVVDAELGSTVCATSILTVRPFCGLRAGFIDQDQHAQIAELFVVPINEDDTLIISEVADFKANQDLWGVGPRVGLNTTWGNCCGFSLLANISAALLYGQAHLHFSEIASAISVEFEEGTIFPDEFELSLLQLSVKDSYWDLFPTLQTLLGISWCRKFNSGCNRLLIEAYWESNFWWASSNEISFDELICLKGVDRKVSMEGLTVRGTLTF